MPLADIERFAANDFCELYFSKVGAVCILSAGKGLPLANICSKRVSIRIVSDVLHLRTWQIAW